ncbi:ABC transporter substrate-binding protein [Gracilibacillus sp. HCP3S3_G5_1]|uniref:ABC transporter substrate-binding protein n=1 Tax=unclassified Gracilibacillus TaxID=2625209 RepID=UPI003F8C7BEC
MEMFKGPNFLFISILLLIFATGCNSEQAEGEESSQKEISILYVEDQFWQDQAQEFEEETGIKVNYEVIGFTELHDTMFTQMSGGSDEYDVIHVRDDWAAEFAAQGFLEPLDEYITDEMKEPFTDISFENLSYDGSIYGIPRYLWLTQLYYNTEIFEEAGLEGSPETWNELIGYAQQIKENTDIDYPLGLQLREEDAIRPFMYTIRTEGGEFWDYENNQPDFNTPEGEEAIQLWQDINIKHQILHPLSFEEDAARDLFFQGELAMFIGYPDIPGYANDPEQSKVVGKVEAALMPGNKVTSASLAETGGMAIPSTSKNKEAAFEFIQFATGYEQEKKMALSEVARIPANLEALQDQEVIDTYPHFGIVGEQIEYPHGLFKHERATLISDTVSRHLIQVIKGDLDSKDALDAAEQEVTSINN